MKIVRKMSKFGPQSHRQDGLTTESYRQNLCVVLARGNSIVKFSTW
jgi:hypothetical protein